MAAGDKTIDKFAFASEGTMTNVGDSTIGNQEGAGGTSSDASGYSHGGGDSVPWYDIIDKFAFASDGNAADVGNLTTGKGRAGNGGHH